MDWTGLDYPCMLRKVYTAVLSANALGDGGEERGKFSRGSGKLVLLFVRSKQQCFSINVWNFLSCARIDGEEEGEGSGGGRSDILCCCFYFFVWRLPSRRLEDGNTGNDDHQQQTAGLALRHDNVNLDRLWFFCVYTCVYVCVCVWCVAGSSYRKVQKSPLVK